MKPETPTVRPNLNAADSKSLVAVAVHRLRQRLRECIRLELADTVLTLEEMEDEMEYLFAAIGGR